jgi:hypothetical protein
VFEKKPGCVYILILTLFGQHNLQIRGSIISNLFSHLSIVLFYMLSLQSSHKEVISMKRMIVWFTTSYAISASRH